MAATYWLSRWLNPSSWNSQESKGCPKRWCNAKSVKCKHILQQSRFLASIYACSWPKICSTFFQVPSKDPLKWIWKWYSDKDQEFTRNRGTSFNLSEAHQPLKLETQSWDFFHWNPSNGLSLDHLLLDDRLHCFANSGERIVKSVNKKSNNSPRTVSRTIMNNITIIGVDPPKTWHRPLDDPNQVPVHTPKAPHVTVDSCNQFRHCHCTVQHLDGASVGAASRSAKWVRSSCELEPLSGVDKEELFKSIHHTTQSNKHDKTVHEL